MMKIIKSFKFKNKNVGYLLFFYYGILREKK